ncbi:hypothetical protein H0H87_009679 [Tephrocybe sp. NHM501043]|nr:hypothetical protein H0H87_009679 [Tephrocybe sp. NHM501043]
MEKPCEDSNPTLQYSLPHTFRIGAKYISTLLITSAQLKGHLALLNVFRGLRTKVEELTIEAWEPDRYIPLDKHKRWVWFVGLAVERFEMWATSLTPEDADRSPLEFLPPLDVLMDPELNKFLNDDSSLARMEFWASRAKKRCFDGLEDAAKHRMKAVLCPFCRKPHEIPFINVNGTGYLQRYFRFGCSNKDCTPLIPINTSLLLRKFAEDFVREDDTPQSYFAYAHLPSSTLRDH